ncbi:MAG: alpha/beta hydrolase [Verrucomicrobia bacterium]|nr:alpha/beta hydrolase [Verrucomicrobiota bacterium]
MSLLAWSGAVGECEVIRDDSIRVAAKAEADGVDVTLEVWPGQVYVFQVRELPESREAIEHIADFMCRRSQEPLSPLSLCRPLRSNTCFQRGPCRSA